MVCQALYVYWTETQEWKNPTAINTLKQTGEPWLKFILEVLKHMEKKKCFFCKKRLILYFLKLANLAKKYLSPKEKGQKLKSILYWKMWCSEAMSQILLWDLVICYRNISFAHAPIWKNTVRLITALWGYLTCVEDQ